MPPAAPAQQTTDNLHACNEPPLVTRLPSLTAAAVTYVLPQLQFHARGPSGRATVSADMYQEGKEWKYGFLYLDIEAPVPQQVGGHHASPAQPDPA
jgi:hypothetical protein